MGLEFQRNQQPAIGYRGNGDATDVTFASLDQPGVWTMRYTNLATAEQQPQIFIDWPLFG